MVKGYDAPLIGNLLSSKENCEAAFGPDFNGIRGLVQRALGGPLPPGTRHQRAGSGGRAEDRY